VDEQLVALYHQHVAAAYDRQMRLGDFLDREAPGADWQYEVPTSTLSFGQTVKFTAHDLGSHATPDNSWLWAWCNPSVTPTPANRELGRAVQQLGERLGIPAFSAMQYFDVTPVLGEELGQIASHVFGIVIGGELGYHAYYTMPFEHGRFTALLRDERLRCNEPYPLLRISTIFPQVISSYPIFSHRAALLGYLDWYAFEPQQDDSCVQVVENGDVVMRAEFDHLSRLTNLSGKLHGRK
jgi:hypothetical protein